MAANFQIFKHRSSDSLHLKLMGDFDGGSATELISEIKKNTNNVAKIVIHTSSLKEIHPLARKVCNRYISEFRNDKTRLRFTGEYAGQIAPDGGLSS